VATTGLGGFSRFRSMGDQTVCAVDPRFPRRRQGAMICRSRSEPRTRWRREATPQRKVSPSTPLASPAVRPGPSGKNFHRHFHRGIRTSGRADKYCERPPPKGGGFGLRLKAGFSRPQGPTRAIPR
jgi:hypothetical protein